MPLKVLQGGLSFQGYLYKLGNYNKPPLTAALTKIANRPSPISRYTKPPSPTTKELPKPVINMYDDRVDHLANAIMGVEMQEHKGDMSKMWHRAHSRNTGPQGSTGYGPYQLTIGKTDDYLKRFPQYFDKDDREWVDNIFRPQAKKFLYHGRMKGKIKDYDPRFDYSGGGLIHGDEDAMAHYLRFARKMMLIDLYNSKGSVYDAAVRWRGSTNPKYNKNYATSVMNYFKNKGLHRFITNRV